MWRNWQTRMVQVHVKAISWGFKSLHPHQKEQYPFGCCSFFVFHMGLEGRVSENSPVDCFPAPPLRPQAGKSLHPHQKLVERRAFFFFHYRMKSPKDPTPSGFLFHQIYGTNLYVTFLQYSAYPCNSLDNTASSLMIR